MQKIKSGDGYFDIQMSIEDHATILLALEGTLAQIGVFNDPFDPIHSKDFNIAIQILKSALTASDRDVVVRELLFPYMDTEIILKKLSHYMKAGQMRIEGLAAEKVQAVSAAFTKVLPKGDVPPHLYPKEYREGPHSPMKKKHA